tara:strand:+ start:306 stop:479 length:174 start_codon:yes stop_codon:yes gene_type:complete
MKKLIATIMLVLLAYLTGTYADGAGGAPGGGAGAGPGLTTGGDGGDGGRGECRVWTT